MRMFEPSHHSRGQSGEHYWPNGKPVARGQRVVGPDGPGTVQAVSCRGFYVRGATSVAGRWSMTRYEWARLVEFRQERTQPEND